MYFKNTTITEMQRALAIVNEKYDNNVEFNRLELSGNRIIATLRVKKSYGKGARLSQCVYTKKNGETYRKHIVNACWHVFGDFFAALLNINSLTVITSLGRTINQYGGNWHDWNIGSIIQPLYYSEACECDN